MSDQPDGAKLLEQARRVLLDELLGALPKGQRLNALMVANAMAMARRELEAAARPESPSAAAVEEIRSGARDGDPALYASLLAEVRQRVSLSNPKRLE